MLVPALTVHVSDVPPPNGATMLSPTPMHWGPPSPNTLLGAGVSRTVVHKSPRVFPRCFGAALADGATSPRATSVINRTRHRRDIGSLLWTSNRRCSRGNSRKLLSARWNGLGARTGLGKVARAASPEHRYAHDQRSRVLN